MVLPIRVGTPWVDYWTSFIYHCDWRGSRAQTWNQNQSPGSKPNALPYKPSHWDQDFLVRSWSETDSLI